MLVMSSFVFVTLAYDVVVVNAFLLEEDCTIIIHFCDTIGSIIFYIMFGYFFGRSERPLFLF